MAKRTSRRSRPPANRSLHTGSPLRLAITLLVPCSLALLQSIGLPGVGTSGLAANGVVKICMGSGPLHQQLIEAAKLAAKLQRD